MEVVFHPVDSLRGQIPTMENQIPEAECCSRLEPESAKVHPSAAPALHLHCQQKSFLAGFKDCHQEMLRYFINVEQTPLEGPAMFGLEKHLTMLETFMQTSLDCTVCSCEHLRRSGDIPASKLSGSANDVATGSFRNWETTATDVGFLDEEETGEISTNRILVKDCRTADDAASSRAENISFDSGCDSSLVGTSSANLSAGAEYEASTAPYPGADRSNGTSDSQTTIGESELAENALELMHLAHNNPRINRILNELFVLMDSDYDDDDDDDNDDDHDDDGIEMEENDGINSESQDDF